jgi:hypothetical protein
MAPAKKKATKSKAPTMQVVIPPPNYGLLTLDIEGTAPYVQLRFSEKAIAEMRLTQEAGSTSRKGKKREKKDFQACYEQAMYAAEEGWRGIPASAFRNAMISACRTVGYQMTKAKLAVWVVADGSDPVEETPLVKITSGKPEMVVHHVRNATGVADLRVRAMWRKWKATVTLKYDADMFTASDVVNLMARVGMQVGIGEGRPDSKSSAGMGWGLFKIANGG